MGSVSRCRPQVVELAMDRSEWGRSATKESKGIRVPCSGAEGV